MTTLPLLSILVALPLIGSALAFAAGAHAARTVALLVATLSLALSLALVAGFDAARDDFQWVHRVPWIPGLGVDWHLGVDGLSLLFVPATCLLFLAAIVGGARAPAQPALHFAALLLLAGATLGVFCALDLILFFFFWELSLLPVWLLCGGRGQAAATRYVLFMLAGGVPLLFGLLLAGSARGGFVSDLTLLLVTAPPAGTQTAVFLLLLAGFAAKVPLVPLHTWLPSLALAAPATLTALVAGLKLGVYGLLRFAIPLAPAAAQEMHWLLAGLGTLAILYGAVATTAQGNLRGVIACGSISHAGLAVLALASFSAVGVQGATLLLLSFPLSAGGGLLLLDALQRRTGSADLSALSGLRQRMPRLTGFFLLFALAGSGLPGTLAFPAELLIVVTTLQTHTGAALAALFGMVVAAGATLGACRYAFFGPLRDGGGFLAAAGADGGTRDDLLPREFAVALVFALLLLATGCFPQLLLALLQVSADTWAARLPAPG